VALTTTDEHDRATAMRGGARRISARLFVAGVVTCTCVWSVAALANAADAPAFVLHSTRPDQAVGALLRLAADGSAQVAGGPAVPGGELVALRRVGLPMPQFPHDRPHALLVTGDRLPGTAVAITGDDLRFLADLGGPQDVTIPLPSLAAVWFTERAALKAATPAGRRLVAEKRRQDVVLLTNSDALQGTVVKLDPDGPLRLDTGGAEVAIARERLQGLLLNTDLARAPRPQSAYRQLVLANGARLSLRTAVMEGANVLGETLGGARLRVPLSVVAALNIYQGKAVYLSDLQPRRYEHTPFLGARWPFAVNRCVTGQDLRLAGGTYDRGLGLHSESRIAFTPPTGATRFEALVGLDELSGRSGHVRVKVLADDRPLLDPPAELSGTDPPRFLRLDLPPGARELTLVVEFGRRGDVQDHVDWADARFILGG
jgi:hypothetical protein